jgi:hypothetical protein
MNKKRTKKAKKGAKRHKKVTKRNKIRTKLETELRVSSIEYRELSIESCPPPAESNIEDRVSSIKYL